MSAPNFEQRLDDKAAIRPRFNLRPLFGLNWSDTAWLILLGLFAVMIRLAYAQFAGKADLSWGDEVTYDLLARNIAAGHGYCFVPGQPSVLRAPLYPMILAAIYRLFGHSYMAVLYIQAVFGGSAAVLVAVLGKRLYSSPFIGLIAGLMFICQPLFVLTTGLLYSETIYLFLLLLFALVCLKMLEKPTKKCWQIVGGIVLGFNVLMKPNLLLFPIWLLVWAWASLRDMRKAIIITAVVSLGMVSVVMPWTVRNYRVTGAFVPVAANMGLNLWQGNHPEADGGALDVKYIDALDSLSETERDRVYRNWAWEWIQHNPGEFVKLAPRKLYKFISPLETSNRGKLHIPFSSLIEVGYGAFLFISVVGLIRTSAHWRRWLLVYLLILYPILLAIVFYGGTRYGIVIQPFLILLAAEPISVALSWVGRRIAIRGTVRSATWKDG